jgi:hypothetical protein
MAPFEWGYFLQQGKLVLATTDYRGIFYDILAGNVFGG